MCPEAGAAKATLKEQAPDLHPSCRLGLNALAQFAIIMGETCAKDDDALVGSVLELASETPLRSLIDGS